MAQRYSGKKPGRYDDKITNEPPKINRQKDKSKCKNVNWKE